MSDGNPFVHDAAPNLDPDRLIEWYVEDHNYSRFMDDRRNVIINGERGSGKSMTLIYHSLQYYARRRSQDGQSGDVVPSVVGIYVPCNTPLSAKEEDRLLPEIVRMRLAEANLTLSVLTNLAREFEGVPDRLDEEDAQTLRGAFADALDVEDFPREVGPFRYLRTVLHRRLRRLQGDLVRNGNDMDELTDTFFLLVLPILEAIRSTRGWKGTHFSFLIDDAQILSPFQKRLLNSWLGFRDNGLFSLKVAIAGLRTYDFTTTHGGTILEGHDYVAVDLQRPIQNRDSEFGRFARDVVGRRLAKAGIQIDAEDFLPDSPAIRRGLQAAEERTKRIAVEKGLVEGTKPFTDFVYKHRRATYFRERPAKANKPIYSGFDTLSHLSTGVIRNMLQPCYFMYEQQIAKNGSEMPSHIDPDVQDEVVKTHSDRLWALLEGNLHQRVANCTVEDGRDIERLFRRLAEYFRERLMRHESEPRVVVFVVSNRDHPGLPELERLLGIAESALLLYVRTGTAKKGGGREPYYVPNRMLLPRYGLDAHGQHGRASLSVEDLLAAAKRDVPIPYGKEAGSVHQRNLFDGE